MEIRLLGPQIGNAASGLRITAMPTARTIGRGDGAPNSEETAWRRG